PNATISQCEKMRRSPNLRRLGGGHETQRHQLSVRKNEAIAFFPNLSRLGGGTKPNASISRSEKMRRSPN
ncbi:MAG: hypothetical protein P5680_27200, partial [Limnospira sp. PMC 737.11]|uniref:hypothetical protein n=1 Tax=Limnospira sp. PMC 737.11 TaxID=2981095 RepID=UPI0028E0B06A